MRNHCGQGPAAGAEHYAKRPVKGMPRRRRRRFHCSLSSTSEMASVDRHSVEKTVEGTPPATLDLDMYPHIMDLIVKYASFSAALALRAVSVALRDKVDKKPAHHLVVSQDKISPHGTDGWHPRLQRRGDDYRAFSTDLGAHVRIVDFDRGASPVLCDSLERALRVHTVRLARVARNPYGVFQSPVYTQKIIFYGRRADAPAEARSLRYDFGVASSSVHHFNANDVAGLEVALVCELMRVLGEAVVILHPSAPTPPRNSSRDHYGFSRLFPRVVRRNVKHMTVVNSECVQRAAFGAHFPSNSSLPPSVPHNPLVQYLHSESNLSDDEFCARFSFLTMDQYRLRVGEKQFQREMEQHVATLGA